MDTLEYNCCVCGYHIYQHIWEATIGEDMGYHLKPNNCIDWYAVAVVQSNTVVEHLPRKLLCIFLLFIRRGSMIQCCEAGRIQYTHDLAQGEITKNFLR